MSTDNIKSCIDSECNDMVSSDQIAQITSVTPGILPSGRAITLNNSGNGAYTLSITNAETMPNTDAGICMMTLGYSFPSNEDYVSIMVYPSYVNTYVPYLSFTSTSIERK